MYQMHKNVDYYFNHIKICISYCSYESKTSYTVKRRFRIDYKLVIKQHETWVERPFGSVAIWECWLVVDIYLPVKSMLCGVPFIIWKSVMPQIQLKTQQFIYYNMQEICSRAARFTSSDQKYKLPLRQIEKGKILFQNL